MHWICDAHSCCCESKLQPARRSKHQTITNFQPAANTVKKPKFFLSSTIYDFSDLRSALKYYLEQQGCLVSASEYPDFKISTDKHSYESCLENISTCDYFIIFIGSRVGGWYDKRNKISITQKEYQTAYELHKSGKIKILAFVRKAIWEHRENRDELQKYLRSLDIEPETKLAISNHPSKICEDSEFIIKFINEVSRNNETKKHLSGDGSPLPTGNWIYTFDGFRDIIDAIETQTISVTPSEQSALKHLLGLELRENLKKLLVRSNDVAYSPINCMRNFYVEHTIGTELMQDGITLVNGKRWGQITLFGIHLMGAKLQTRVLDHCMLTSTFVEYDTHAGNFASTPIHAALLKLSAEIDQFRMVEHNKVLSVIFEFSPKNGHRANSDKPIPTLKLFQILHLFDRWINIIEISKSIIKYLEDGNFIDPQIRPQSPIPDLNPQLESEAVNDKILKNFLSEGN